MPSTRDLPYLLSLLDDDDPVVRPAVKEWFSACDGDLSHDLAALGQSISRSGKKRLAQWLEPGRRKTLMEEWQVPSGGVHGIADDWDTFENLLRLLSDFLHDGVTLRPSLPDQLDLLEEEIREAFFNTAYPTAEDLRVWLFVDGPFRRDMHSNEYRDYLVNFDLCHVIDNRQGNSISLGCLYMLVAHRLGITVDGCNYPGNFLTRVQIENRDYVVDCFHSGRIFNVDELLEGHLGLSDRAKRAIIAPCGLGVVLLRYLIEMRYRLVADGRKEDALLMKQLVKTLRG